MSHVRLLLISRDDIIGMMNDTESEKVFRLLASLTRQGWHFLATAPQPDKWSGEHGSPDDALLGPKSIRKHLLDAGGMLDGVYYVRRSLLTQKRNREDALSDILQRYAAMPADAVLLSSKRAFIKTARDMGLQAILLDGDEALLQQLSALNEAGIDPN